MTSGIINTSTPVECALTATRDSLSELINVLRQGGMDHHDAAGKAHILDQAQELIGMMQAVDAEVIAACRDGDVLEKECQRSMTKVLQRRCLIGPGEAARRVKAAEAIGSRMSLVGLPLPRLRPQIADAVAEGTINPDQLRTVCKTLNQLDTAGIDPSTIDQVEAELVDHCARFGPRELATIGTTYLNTLDPDGTEPDEDRNHDQRSVMVQPMANGAYKLDGRLTGELGAKLAAILSPLAKPRIPKTDDLDSTGGVSAVDLLDQRTHGQRMHDALDEAVSRLLRSGDLPDSGGTPASVIITTDINDLLTHTQHARESHDDPEWVCQHCGATNHDTNDDHHDQASGNRPDPTEGDSVDRSGPNDDRQKHRTRPGPVNGDNHDHQRSPGPINNDTHDHPDPSDPINDNLINDHDVPTDPITSSPTNDHDVPTDPITSSPTNDHDVPTDPITSSPTNDHDVPTDPITSSPTNDHDVPTDPITSSPINDHDVPTDPMNNNPINDHVPTDLINDSPIDSQDRPGPINNQGIPPDQINDQVDPTVPINDQDDQDRLGPITTAQRSPSRLHPPGRVRRKRPGHGTTSFGATLTIPELLRLANEADIYPVVMTQHGQLLDMGRSRRIATKTQTMALIARDGGCSFPACDHPPEWCERHHIISWLENGTTGVDNLTLLCSFHHHQFLLRGWTVKINNDGLPEWTPPRWIDPEQTPMINNRIIARIHQAALID